MGAWSCAGAPYTIFQTSSCTPLGRVGGWMVGTLSSHSSVVDGTTFVNATTISGLQGTNVVAEVW